jgi:glycosyltransferase involved in cell wall biosynthesis
MNKDTIKNVLVFSLAYEPLTGGAEVAIREICKSSPEYHFDILTVKINKDHPAVEERGNITIYRLGFNSAQSVDLKQETFLFKLNKYLFPFLSLLKGSSLLKFRKYDFTWCMMANYGGFGAMFFKHFHPEVPFVLTLQEGDPFEYIKKRVGIFWPLYLKIFEKADRVQAISNYLSDYAKKLGFKGEPVVIPNGANLSVFSADYDEEELLKLRRKVAQDDERIIVTASRLVVKNGVADLIAAMSRLPENVKLLILGTGPLEKDLKDLAREEGVQYRVEFLGDKKHEEVAKYFKVSDVFCRPSLSEGLGNAFIEAMAAGLPIVGTPVGGIPDFLIDMETGVFAEVQNPDNLAEKLKLLLNKVRTADKIAKHGKKVAMKNYSWEPIVERMKTEVFEEAS